MHESRLSGSPIRRLIVQRILGGFLIVLLLAPLAFSQKRPTYFEIKKHVLEGENMVIYQENFGLEPLSITGLYCQVVSGGLFGQYMQEIKERITGINVYEFKLQDFKIRDGRTRAASTVELECKYRNIHLPDSVFINFTAMIWIIVSKYWDHSLASNGKLELKFWDSGVHVELPPLRTNDPDISISDSRNAIGFDLGEEFVLEKGQSLLPVPMIEEAVSLVILPDGTLVTVNKLLGHFSQRESYNIRFYGAETVSLAGQEGGMGLDGHPLLKGHWLPEGLLFWQLFVFPEAICEGALALLVSELITGKIYLLKATREKIYIDTPVVLPSDILNCKATLVEAVDRVQWLFSCLGGREDRIYVFRVGDQLFGFRMILGLQQAYQQEMLWVNLNSKQFLDLQGKYPQVGNGSGSIKDYFWVAVEEQQEGMRRKLPKSLEFVYHNHESGGVTIIQFSFGGAARYFIQALYGSDVGYPVERVQGYTFSYHNYLGLVAYGASQLDVVRYYSEPDRNSLYLQSFYVESEKLLVVMRSAKTTLGSDYIIISFHRIEDDLAADSRLLGTIKIFYPICSHAWQMISREILEITFLGTCYPNSRRWDLSANTIHRFRIRTSEMKIKLWLLPDAPEQGVFNLTINDRVTLPISYSGFDRSLSETSVRCSARGNSRPSVCEYKLGHNPQELEKIQLSSFIVIRGPVRGIRQKLVNQSEWSSRSPISVVAAAEVSSSHQREALRCLSFLRVAEQGNKTNTKPGKIWACQISDSLIHFQDENEKFLCYWDAFMTEYPDSEGVRPSRWEDYQPFRNGNILYIAFPYLLLNEQIIQILVKYVVYKIDLDNPLPRWEEAFSQQLVGVYEGRPQESSIYDLHFKLQFYPEQNILQGFVRTDKYVNFIGIQSHNSMIPGTKDTTLSKKLQRPKGVGKTRALSTRISADMLIWKNFTIVSMIDDSGYTKRSLWQVAYSQSLELMQLDFDTEFLRTNIDPGASAVRFMQHSSNRTFDVADCHNPKNDTVLIKVTEILRVSTTTLEQWNYCLLVDRRADPALPQKPSGFFSEYRVQSVPVSTTYFIPDTEGVGTLHTMCHHFVVMKQRPDSAESSADLYIYALDVSSLQQVLTVPYQLGASLDFYCEEDTDYISLYDSVGGQHTIYKLSEPAILLNTTNLKQSTEFMLVFEGPKAKNSTKPVLIRITRDDADDVGLYPRNRFWTTVSSNWVLSTLCLLAAISLVVLCYLIFCTKTCGRSNKDRSPDQ